MASEMTLLIGRNLKVARNEKGWKQRELAREVAKIDPDVANPDDASISNTSISEWERGVRAPGDRYMPLLAQALGKETSWFYTDHSKPKSGESAKEVRQSNDAVPDLMGELSKAEIREELEQLGERLDRLQAVLDELAGEKVVAAALRALDRAKKQGSSKRPPRAA